MSNFGYYIFALVLLVVGIMVVKKVTTCLFKATRNIIIFQGFFLLYNKSIPNIKYLEYFS